MNNPLYYITFFILFMAFGSAWAINVDQLKCECRINPLGIDSEQPRLSWILNSEERGDIQAAYQILVASEKDLLSEDSADMWNSGKIVSKKSVHIVYQGKILKTKQRYFWKIRAWDKKDESCEWSEAGWWEMGLIDENNWKAFWINDGKPIPATDEDFYKEDPAPLFRKQFCLQKEIKSARLYITGLGYYEAFLNGKKVGNRVLDPGWTNFNKRVYYSIFDVKELLISGKNCLGITLGNGWYNPLPLRMWGRLNLREHLPTGRPQFIAQLEIKYQDETQDIIISDRSWKFKEGALLKNNIYLGEVYDARRGLIGW